MRLKTSSSLKEEAAEEIAEFGLAAARSGGGEIVKDAGIDVELFVLILGEVVGIDIVAESVVAGGEGFGAREEFDEGGFASAVDADESDAVTTLNDEIDVIENALGAVVFRDAFEFGNDAAAGFGLGEGEVDGGFFGREFDALNLFELFDAALDLLGFGGLGAEAIDEGFELLNFVALVFVSGLELKRGVRLSGCGIFRSLRCRR